MTTQMNEREGAVVFRIEEGIVVPAVTADQVREVDRIAMEEFGLGILQMLKLRRSPNTSNERS